MRKLRLAGMALGLFLGLMPCMNATAFNVNAAEAGIPDENTPLLEPGTDMEAVIENEGAMAYFRILPSETSTYIFTALGEEDTVGHLYDGSMVELSFDDDEGNGSNFMIEYDLEAGETYYLGVHLYDNAIGSFTVRMTRSNHLEAKAADGVYELYIQPLSSAVLRVEASCITGEMTYQWYRYGDEGYTAIEGATAPEYTTEPLAYYDKYYCEVKDIFGSRKEVDFWVYIDNKLEAHPADGRSDLYILPQNSVELRVEASCTAGELLWQWYKYIPENEEGYSEWKAIEGEDTSVYTTEELTENAQYQCRVSDMYGNSVYAYFRINVINAQTIKPGDQLTANIENYGDQAYFSFIPTETGRYAFYSVSEDRTNGYLYDAELNELLSDYYGGDGTNFKIRYTLEAGKQYFFGTRLSSYSSGSFDVKLEQYTVPTSGECGDGVSWTFGNARLTISGSGNMQDYERYNSMPWYDHLEEIREVVIEPGVTGIGALAFYACSNLTDVTIPNSVTSIGESAFSACENLVNAEIPDSVTSIGKNVFNRCRKLTDIKLSSNVTSIEYGAFGNCDSLMSVDLPSTVTSIGGRAFGGCTALTEIALPDTLTDIGDWAFWGCSGLTNVELPSGTTNIGSRAFWSTGLTGVEIPSGVTQIGTRVFWECSDLTRIDVSEDNAVYSSQDGVLFSKDKTKIIAWPEGKAGIYEIPDGVTDIMDYAFEHSKKLTEITIPASVTYIGNNVFGGSGQRKIYFTGDAPDFDASAFRNATADVYYPAKNPTWTDEVRQNYRGTITWIPYSPTIPFGEPDFILPTAIQSIEESAFEGLALTAVYIPDRCTSVGDYAFKNCSRLTKIRIPEHCVIADTAFEGCGGVYIFGKPGSSAEAYCESHAYCTFMAEE